MCTSLEDLIEVSSFRRRGKTKISLSTGSAQPGKQRMSSASVCKITNTYTARNTPHGSGKEAKHGRRDVGDT